MSVNVARNSRPKKLSSPKSAAQPMLVVRRIQLSRAKGWRMPENTRKVDSATVHGNPFPVEKFGREQAIQLYRN